VQRAGSAIRRGSETRRQEGAAGDVGNPYTQQTADRAKADLNAGKQLTRGAVNELRNLSPAALRSLGLEPQHIKEIYRLGDKLEK